MEYKAKTRRERVSLFLVLILVISLISGLAARTALADETLPDASGADDYSGGDGGEEPADSAVIRQQLVYYWHKGLPPLDGREYPVLLCWDDKFYLKTDASFLQWMYKAIPTDSNETNICWIDDGFSATGYTNGWQKKGNGYPTGQYRIQVGYPSEGSNLLADLDFDYKVLKSTGTAVSFSLPDLPVMRRIEKKQYPDWYTIEEEKKADRVFIGVRPTQEMIDEAISRERFWGTSVWRNMFKADETNWLMGVRYLDYYVSTDSFLGISYDSKQRRVFNWYLSPVNSYSYNKLPNFLFGAIRNLSNLYDAASVEAFMNESSNLEMLAWNVSEQDGKFVFSEKGVQTERGRVSGSFDDSKQLTNMISADPDIILGHSESIFASYGNRAVYDFKPVDHWGSADYGTRSKWGFDVYYAEPNLMYFLKNDIVVENGQTQTLDGPLVIEEGTTITVKDGGVLSLTDWIVNKGQIHIQPGGTMILQQNTTGNGYTRNCAVISNNKNDNYSGAVLCDGNIIIMPNCTLEAGGLWGFEFGEGAQVANYGQMIAENWTIFTSYTIEGRDSNSRMYMGYAMSDTGFSMVPEGYREVTGLVQYHSPTCIRAENAFYGKSVFRTVNPRLWENIRTQKGRVTPITQ